MSTLMSRRGSKVLDILEQSRHFTGERESERERMGIFKMNFQPTTRKQNFYLTTLASVIATKYLMHQRGRLRVDIQFLVDAMQTAFLETVYEVAKKLVGIFLSSLMKVSGNGAEVFDDRDGLDVAVGRVEDSSAVAMELAHSTECLCVACITLHHHYIIITQHHPHCITNTQLLVDRQN